MELSIQHLTAELAETRRHRAQKQQDGGTSSACDGAAAAEVGTADASGGQRQALEVAGLRQELQEVKVRVLLSGRPRRGTMTSCDAYVLHLVLVGGSI